MLFVANRRGGGGVVVFAVRHPLGLHLSPPHGQAAQHSRRLLAVHLLPAPGAAFTDSHLTDTLQQGALALRRCRWKSDLTIRPLMGAKGVT